MYHKLRVFNIIKYQFLNDFTLESKLIGNIQYFLLAKFVHRYNSDVLYGYQSLTCWKCAKILKKINFYNAKEK